MAAAIAASASSASAGCGHAAALPEREGDDDRAAERGAPPEDARRPLVRDPRARERRRERQQADDHGAMRGGHVAHRQRREQRKADDHATGDQREPRQCARARPRCAGRGEHDRRKHRRDHRAAEADEHGIEIRDRDARRGQRQAEARDPQQSPQKAVPTLTRRAGVSRYRCGFIQGHRRLVPRRGHSTACPGRPRVAIAAFELPLR